MRAWPVAVAVGLAACAPEAERVGGRGGGDPETPGTTTAPLRFGFPVADPATISTRVGVDHDPVDHPGALGDLDCTDYLERPFPHCYDQHDGSDFILDGGFEAMDAGSVAVLAAQDGVVVDAVDGHYDRCHAELEGGVTCDGMSDGTANSVTLEHADGSRTLYWHLKQDSVAVAVGDAVACGDRLGLVGSSGYSSMPHLHFELQDAGGAVVDPYAGPASQEESFWAEQQPDPELPGPGCTQAR